MDFNVFLDEIEADPDYGGQIAHRAELPACEARYGALQAELHPEVQAILDDLGITQLYSHQTEAIEAAFSGENVAVVAGTASGKTLCFTIPVAQSLYERGTNRALLIYPTKALAQDQLRKLADFGAGTVFTAETYDGDTPSAQRRRIKKSAQVVLTNPDMLHVGILPYHHTWADFFRNLKFVVLDEVHTYRGVFGSHAANVVRRLRRIARHYGTNPQFICCSATIGNPAELCEKLTGLEFKVVDDDGSPAGRRTFVMWRPPLMQRRRDRRRSANQEAADLMARLLRREIRTITFTLARSQAELILRYTRDKLGDAELAAKLMAYRGGYLPAERRAIENQLFDGKLLGVVSTTALELGVDIGGLDAALMVGYPGSVASTWQQAGRAGRGLQDSLAALIALPGGIHHYLMEHPEYILDRSVERVLIDPYNKFVVAAHLMCASYELPLIEADEVLFGPQMEPILELLVEHGYVTKRTKWYWIDADLYPAGQFSIRSASGAGYDIVREKSDELLGTMDEASAFMMVHPGAIYLHGGDSYLVTKLDTEARIAYVRPTRARYYTQPLVMSEVRVLSGDTSRPLSDTANAHLGELSVHTTVAGYRKLRQVTEQELGQEPLDLPPRTFETIGAWVTIGEQELKALAEEKCDVMGSLHALEHALIGLLPLFASCDPHDVGGVSHHSHQDTGAPSILVYDGYPGGVGICEAAYERIEELIAATVETIETCPCEAGCPNCVQSPSCGDGNQPLDKRGAIVLGRALIPSQGQR